MAVILEPWLSLDSSFSGSHAWCTPLLWWNKAFNRFMWTKRQHKGPHLARESHCFSEDYFPSSPDTQMSPGILFPLILWPPATMLLGPALGTLYTGSSSFLTYLLPCFGGHSFQELPETWGTQGKLFLELSRLKMSVLHLIDICADNVFEMGNNFAPLTFNSQ